MSLLSLDLSVVTAGQTEFFIQAYRHALSHCCSFIIAATPDQADSLVHFLSQQGVDVSIFPDLELIPFDLGSVSPDIIQQRYQCLYRMMTQKNWVVVSSPFALAYPLRSEEYLFHNVISLEIGKKLDRQAMIEAWVLQGYVSVPEVTQGGEFAVRGEVLDWFPIGQDVPLRLNIVENSLEKLRTFDPQTQRTLENIVRKISLPSSDFPLKENDYKRIIQKFRIDFSDRSSIFYKKLDIGIRARQRTGSFVIPVLQYIAS
jgi:transcription-repair coupling factor (superfamily II helicase)